MMMEGGFGFDSLATWVTSFTTMLSNMFTSLTSMWPIFVPLGIGVFGYIFGKLRGALRLGGKKKGR